MVYCSSTVCLPHLEEVAHHRHIGVVLVVHLVQTLNAYAVERVIGDNVFYGCDKLKNVVIPDGLKKIGILQERTKTMVKYKDVDYTITQLVNLIYKETKDN